jgi:hypothetical protein
VHPWLSHPLAGFAGHRIPATGAIGASAFGASAPEDDEQWLDAE